jgi:micrococcal nuclease
LYGRVLADIWVNNQRLDSTLIRNGWAWHYQTYSNDSLLKSMMVLAINENKGIWKCGMTGVCPPSFWRSYNKNNKVNNSYYHDLRDNKVIYMKNIAIFI